MILLPSGVKAPWKDEICVHGFGLSCEHGASRFSFDASVSSGAGSVAAAPVIGSSDMMYVSTLDQLQHRAPRAALSRGARFLIFVKAARTPAAA